MKRDHLEFLCNVSELSTVFTDSQDVDSLLQRLVQLVGRHLQAHVCSLYLVDSPAGDLLLRATVGLDTSDGRSIRLREGEGLVGTAIEQRRPLLDNHASRNPRYKFIPGIGEERFDSFIAVPLLKGKDKLGVLVVQREERDHFDEDDVNALRVVACQLVGCVENAQALSALTTSRTTPTSNGIVSCPPLIKANVAAPGDAIGPARVLQQGESFLERLELLAADLTPEQFHQAVDKTEGQLMELQRRVAERLPEAVSLIFSAHLLMLRDQGFVGEMSRRIELGTTVRQAVAEVAQSYISAFGSSQAVYIRDKAQDVEDLAVRLTTNLSDVELESSQVLERHEIVIARSVLPSELVMLALEDPAGFVLVEGAATSHVAILARSFQVPLFIADEPSLLEIPDGTPVLLDGHTGNLYVAPREDVLKMFTARCPDPSSDTAVRVPRPTTHTRDGTAVKLLANINLLSELPVAMRMNVEGIGLYRTEFPFLIRTSFPDEEEQYLVYRRLVQGAEGRPVTFRTLDVGGDKSLSYYELAGEENPELGLRAIRFSLRHPELFRQQLRAILRAGEGVEELKIMFPMVSSLDEFRSSRAMIIAEIRDLRRQGIPCHAQPSIGMMVEMPSVLELATEFALEADFFSIGSNDFVQYMMAADRGNEHVASYYCPHHPSVLRSLARFVATAQSHGRTVSLCGEMAHQPKYLSFLLGIGLRELSVAPFRVAVLQEMIESLDLRETELLAQRMLKESTVAGVERWLEVQSPAGTSG